MRIKKVSFGIMETKMGIIIRSKIVNLIRDFKRDIKKIKAREWNES